MAAPLLRPYAPWIPASLAALLGLLAAAAPAMAEGDVDGAPAPVVACKAAGPGTRITATFGPDTSLRDLTAWLASFTCKNVVFSAEVAQRGAKVNILAPAAMSPKQAQRLFTTAVEALGLVVEDKAGTVVIKPGRALKAGCAALRASGDDQAAGGDLGGDPFNTWPPRPSTSPEAEGVTPAELDAGIKAIDATHVQVSRALVDKWLDNPMWAAKGARMVPAMKNGQPDGIKLYAIRPGSVWARLGLMNGDTVQAVNGHDLRSADKALETYRVLRGASKLELTLLRRGKPTTLVITVK